MSSNSSSVIGLQSNIKSEITYDNCKTQLYFELYLCLGIRHGVNIMGINVFLFYIEHFYIDCLLVSTPVLWLTIGLGRLIQLLQSIECIF